MTIWRSGYTTELIPKRRFILVTGPKVSEEIPSWLISVEPQQHGQKERERQCEEGEERRVPEWVIGAQREYGKENPAEGV